MFDSFKRRLAGRSSDFGAIQAWAQRRQRQFKPVRDRQGFIVEGALLGRTWRLEWGPPQRSYITGRELRLRIELGLPAEMQLLLMSRPLMEALERQTFERYTEQMQTQIDLATPEEMRWLAMLPAVELSGEREFRQRFAAVASAPKLGADWIAGALAERLDALAKGPLAAQPPLLLMTLRGRLYLRTELEAPDPEFLEPLVGLFECASTQALRLGVPLGADAGPSTTSTAWQTQLQPEPPKR